MFCTIVLHPKVNIPIINNPCFRRRGRERRWIPAVGGGEPTPGRPTDNQSRTRRKETRTRSKGKQKVQEIKEKQEDQEK